MTQNYFSFYFSISQVLTPIWGWGLDCHKILKGRLLVLEKNIKICDWDSQKLDKITFTKFSEDIVLKVIILGNNSQNTLNKELLKLCYSNNSF